MSKNSGKKIHTHLLVARIGRGARQATPRRLLAKRPFHLPVRLDPPDGRERLPSLTVVPLTAVQQVGRRQSPGLDDLLDLVPKSTFLDFNIPRWLPFNSWGL